jgi:hypothetical protein
MSKLRDWYWKIEGRGPDYYFRASFRPSDAEHLASLLRQHPPKGFKLYQAGASRLNQTASICDYYFEKYRYEQMVAAHEGRLGKNIYTYELIRVCEHELKIERAFGGAEGDGQNASEMLLILAQSPGLNWIQWEVSFAGGGYHGGTAATGNTGSDLILYLTGR